MRARDTRHIVGRIVTEDSVWGPATTTPKPPTYKPYRMYTKYRYDALGRRVWARVIRGSNCAAKHVSLPYTCRSTLTRSLWDGNTLVFEVRVPGDSTASATTLEQDGAATLPYYGRVGYVEGAGLDAPVALFKEGLVVYPYADWRGVFGTGTCVPGPCPTDLQFPGGQGSVGAWGPAGLDPDGAGWYGSLVWAQQDATGRQYKRNRYYDVETGQFTQEDPLGLAGGLNLYGYAGGDPLNFSDPFGLCPDPKKPWCTSPLYYSLRFFGASEATADKWAGLAFGGAAVAGAPGSGAIVRGMGAGLAAIAAAQDAGTIPSHAIRTLSEIQSTGRAPAGYRGGGVFTNDGRGGGQVLPRTTEGGDLISYREWDVNPYVKGVNRGPQRLVTGSDGSAYFTNDHYTTFTRLPQ